VAHDFNNILSAIIGYSSLLQMKMENDDPLRVYVQHILESAERSAEVTHSLLAFSRKQVIKPMPVNLAGIIRRFEKLLSRVIGEDIELRTELAKEEIIIMADSGQIEQVLMNLATNARDAMPRGGRFVVKTAVAGPDNDFLQANGHGEFGRYAVLTVEDTGTGMSEEVTTKIFEPFFTTKEPGRGTGLGLAMAYGIIKQHEGYVNVSSESGRGTTVDIYLPLVASKETASLPPFAANSLPGGTETVLVAEDDENLRKLTAAILGEYGYRVISAEDGEDAITKFGDNKDRVQLVILDMVMPKKGGNEVAEEIRRVSPGVKILFASGYTADRNLRQMALGEGMNFIMKPLTPKDLLVKVREMLDGV
jgi:CheY-like chemotaxis protein